MQAPGEQAGGVGGVDVRMTRAAAPRLEERRRSWRADHY